MIRSPPKRPAAASPPRGHRWRTGKAGSAAVAGLAATLPGLGFALVLLAAFGALAFTLPEAQRDALWAIVQPNAALVLMVWFFASLVAGRLAHQAWQRHAAAPGRLAERVQVLLSATPALDAATPAPGGGLSLLDAGEGASDGSIALTAAVAALVLQRDALRREIGQRIAEGSREVEQEKNRLAALMAELTQSVVVCNLDGRILLFNARARLQFRALAGAAATGTPALGGESRPSAPLGGAESIGLGRSIYGVLDRRLVAHALEAVQQRLARGAANPSAQFVTGTQSGQLLRVQLAPVKEPGANSDAGGGAGGAQAPLNGFVLVLENITREMAAEREREQLLARLTEGSRGSIGSLQAAVELLDDPGLDAAGRERFLAVIREEIGALARRLNEAAAQGAQALEQRWPLEDMLGSDFVTAALRRLQAEVGQGLAADAGEVDAELWLRVESFSLVQALVHLAQRLAEAYAVPRVSLRLAQTVHRGHARACLDLVFPALAVSTETVVAWESEPLQGGSAGAAAATGDRAGTLTLRDVVQRHGGAFWFERDRARQLAWFRFLLPLAGEAAPLQAEALLRHESRPEFYDFNLFALRGAGEGDAAGAELAARPLRELTYTVFDTETTGLEPGAGDKIIQIGATRIVGARLRRQESFEQLVDPGRAVSPAARAVHGISAEMLRGQPAEADVLPAFHAFAHDSVLVAHNAAFDMRFLQLAEPGSGVRFEQPVLDTLLLSAVLHPQQQGHSLEAIAKRLGVPVLGRHTALGDAIVTAEVFVKMIPLLEAAGMHTLGQALEASRQTYLARLSY